MLALKYGNLRKITDVGAGCVLAISILCSQAFAGDKVEGMIKARSGSSIILTTTTETYVNVLLDEATSVSQNQGLTKVRKKKMSMAALIPGLQIVVDGRYDENRMFVAKSITFNGNDLERANSIQAGLAETEARSKANEAKAAEHAADLEKQKAALEEQNAALLKQQSQLKEHEAKIAANRAQIEANTARFGQLDDYYIYDEVTVFFANGKSVVDPMYTPKLALLAEKAVTVEGYMIQVKGFASASGGTALNQKLSSDRAAEVSNILIQQGHVPLSRMLAPGAMGESQATETGSAADQAADRKVVVRVLQNKGIAGIK